MFNYMINFKFRIDSSSRLVGERAYIEYSTFMGLCVKRLGFSHYWLAYIDSKEVITL
jgi:hypothetical protein